VPKKNKSEDLESLIQPESPSEGLAEYVWPERVSLEQNLSVIKDNIRSTLDPAYWGEGVTKEQFDDVLRRNKALISMLTLAENISIKTESGKRNVVCASASIKDGKSIDVADSSAAYIGMGGRVLLEFDPKSHDKVLPTIYGFESMDEFYSKVSDDVDKPTESKHIAIRRTSSHSVALKDGQIKESRGVLVGLGNAISSIGGKKIVSEKDSNMQFGMHLSVFGLNNDSFVDVRRAEKQRFVSSKKDAKRAVTPDGSFGHLLSVVNARDGVIMMGIEKSGYNCEAAIPEDAKHDLRAKSGKISSFGGLKHRAFEHHEYEALGLVKPQLSDDEPIGAMIIKVDEKVLQLVKARQEEYEKFAIASFQALKISQYAEKTVGIASEVNRISRESPRQVTKGARHA